MPTKWLQERPNGSKDHPRMPPRRVSRGHHRWSGMSGPRSSYAGPGPGLRRSEGIASVEPFWQLWSRGRSKRCDFRRFECIYLTIMNISSVLISVWSRGHIAHSSLTLSTLRTFCQNLQNVEKHNRVRVCEDRIGTDLPRARTQVIYE